MPRPIFRAGHSFLRRLRAFRNDTTTAGLEVFVEQIGRFHPKRLRQMPERQQRDVLLATFHTADVSPVDAHPFSDGLLTETGLHSKPAQIFPEHLSNIHP
jgi:hypothetical protein